MDLNIRKGKGVTMDFNFDQQPGKKLLSRGIINEGPPLLSIITPYFNAGQYFEQTANCVFNQTFPYFEWIIVNDGSTNNEDVSILLDIAKKDSRIKVHHKDNGGAATARNKAIELTSTDIIVTLDADDLIEPTYLECIYWSLYCNPQASWTYTDSTGFASKEYLWNKHFSSEVMKSENILCYSAGFRKKDLLEVGGYDSFAKFYFEDWTLWLKLLKKGKLPVHMRWYGFWYRNSNTGGLAKINNDKELYSKAMRIIEETASELDDSVQAIEFPRYRGVDFEKPRKWEWNRGPIFDDNKIRVLMILPHMVMGGANQFDLNIISRLNKERFDVSVVTTNPDEPTWRQRFEEHVTDIFDLTTFLDVADWSAFIHYLIKTRDISVVMVDNSYLGYYLIPWLKKEFPHLMIVDYVHSEVENWRGGGYARTSSVVNNIVDKTFVCNENLRQTMINKYRRSPENIETLYIGVDKDYYDPRTISKGIIRRKINIDESRPVVLFPCRLSEEKRPFLMLEIAKATKKVIPDVCFFVVGDGQYYGDIQDRIKKENLINTVFLFGRQQDMRPFYKDSDITLICSRVEGLALTAYESMSMGTPVISSDVGGQKELVDSSTGALLPFLELVADYFDKDRKYTKQEIMQYVEAIKDILKDKKKYEQMSQNCRARIVDNFSVDNIIVKLESYFMNHRYIANQNISHEHLGMLGDLVDDHLTMYYEFLQREADLEWIWNQRLELSQTLENNLIEDDSSHLEHAALLELKRIYAMRSWKLVQKYQKFMDSTTLGRMFSRIRNIIK
ncbi:glycosyltransferase [Paenibacillus terreus]|uniref:Glycosyltransferase n=1 Tax=Paenibacillus terreus TaxID=1387834 RepID=A0ABV5BFL3_9BACL